ncbi:ThiF family adenylyltransferase, partial [Elusimicrobiota bacterium]
MSKPLTKNQLLRYNRHIVLPEIGAQGQRKFLNSKVMIVGAGGLGSPLALYLGACGIGKLGIIDFDKVELTNLQRQILYKTKDIGQFKTKIVQKRISSLNPEIKINILNEKLNPANAVKLLSGYDIIADCTDNIFSRYIINDACIQLKKPFVHGSISGFEGQTSVFYPRKGPCYKCLFAEPAPYEQDLIGPIGVLPGLIGTIQATEIIKLVLGKGKPLIGRLLLYDAMEMRFNEVRFKRNPKCTACGK